MQKIEIDVKSPLAEALISASYDSNHQTIVSVKTTSGDSLYRGILSKWNGNKDVLVVEIEDWDSYWGHMMARKYSV